MATKSFESATLEPSGDKAAGHGWGTYAVWPFAIRAARPQKNKPIASTPAKIVAAKILFFIPPLYHNDSRRLFQSYSLSGRWELNPVYALPKRAYYRYTTARSPLNYPTFHIESKPSRPC